MLIFIPISLFVLIQSLSANSIHSLVPRIVGGKETTIEEHPWQVQLEIRILNMSHLCGGSIIGDRWVLTAAHCTYRSSSDNITVRVGSTYKNKGAIVKVAQKFEHNYNEHTYDYDIALLKLSKPLNFTNKIKPIALPDSDTEISDGTMVVVSGWGRTCKSNKASDQLRAVRIPIVNQEDCANKYLMENPRGIHAITDRMICAGFEEGGKSAFKGDSGGPLTSSTEVGDPLLIGVVSWGGDVCTRQVPGVYARVTYFRLWIKEITGI